MSVKLTFCQGDERTPRHTAQPDDTGVCSRTSGKDILHKCLGLPVKKAVSERAEPKVANCDSNYSNEQLDFTSY